MSMGKSISNFWANSSVFTRSTSNGRLVNILFIFALAFSPIDLARAANLAAQNTIPQEESVDNVFDDWQRIVYGRSNSFPASTRSNSQQTVVAAEGAKSLNLTTDNPSLS
jgi:hypothetical protein